MQTLRIPIRVVFYRDEGDWMAHCLEFDLLGHGATREQALDRLSEAIRVQVAATVEHENAANLFSPADGRYFEMFAAGHNVTEGELRLAFESMDPVIIERVETREFADAAPA